MKKTVVKKAPQRADRLAASKAPAKAPAKAPSKAPSKAAVSRAPKTVAKPEPKAVAKGKSSRVAPEAPAKRAAAAPARPARPPRDAASRKRMARFRELLVGRHRALLAAYRSGKGSTRETKSDGTEDYIDYAVNSYDRDFLLSLTEMEQRHMLLIEEALKRIDRGEFGRCLQCSQEIPENRIEVEPWARHCVRCQELEEQGLLLQQQPGGGDGDYDDEPRSEEAPETDEEAEPEEDLVEDPPGADAGHDDDELNA